MLCIVDRWTGTVTPGGNAPHAAETIPLPWMRIHAPNEGYSSAYPGYLECIPWPMGGHEQTRIEQTADTGYRRVQCVFSIALFAGGVHTGLKRELTGSFRRRRALVTLCRGPNLFERPSLPSVS
jgi:hypothetical protein